MAAREFGTTPTTVPCIFLANYHKLVCGHWAHTSQPTYCAPNCSEPYPHMARNEQNPRFLCVICMLKVMETWEGVAESLAAARAEERKPLVAGNGKGIREVLAERRKLWRRVVEVKLEYFEGINKSREYYVGSDSFEIKEWDKYRFAVDDLDGDKLAARLEDMTTKNGIDGLGELEETENFNILERFDRAARKADTKMRQAVAPERPWRDRSRSPGRDGRSTNPNSDGTRQRSPGRGLRRMHDRFANEPQNDRRGKWRPRSASPTDMHCMFDSMSLKPKPQYEKNDTRNPNLPASKSVCPCGSSKEEFVIICDNKWCQQTYHLKSCAKLEKRPSRRWLCASCSDLPEQCYCRGRKEDALISCHGRGCKTSQFHLSCVELTVTEDQRLGKQDWYCPSCDLANKGAAKCCVCRLPDFGIAMIACEYENRGCEDCDHYDEDCPLCRVSDDRCPVGWYHLPCVGMTEVPKQEKWECRKCLDRAQCKRLAAEKAKEGAVKQHKPEVAGLRRSERATKGLLPKRFRDVDVGDLAQGIRQMDMEQ